jgi:hypothetical protein
VGEQHLGLRAVPGPAWCLTLRVNPSSGLPIPAPQAVRGVDLDCHLLRWHCYCVYGDSWSSTCGSFASHKPPGIRVRRNRSSELRTRCTCSTAPDLHRHQSTAMSDAFEWETKSQNNWQFNNGTPKVWIANCCCKKQSNKYILLYTHCFPSPLADNLWLNHHIDLRSYDDVMKLIFMTPMCLSRRSQWPRGLRHELCLLAQTLG